MAQVLVTGGAGFIGSHICKQLKQQGHTPFTYDNLSRGFKKTVRWGEFIQGDIRDGNKLTKTLKEHSISAVIHLAAFAYVKESVEQPHMYFENNVEGTAILLEAMKRAEVKNLLFSSSCATYGESQGAPISESHSQNPINPYGLSKLICEQMIDKIPQSELNSCSLRYFNAAGADLDGEIGENHDPEPHLIPTLIDRAINHKTLNLFGDKYPTADGTCIRDFIHVSDLAEAHVLCLESLLLKTNKHRQYNLGTGQGHSLKQVAETILKIINSQSKIEIQPARSGDPAQLICDAHRFQAEFNWKPRHSDLETIIKSAHQWRLKK